VADPEGRVRLDAADGRLTGARGPLLLQLLLPLGLGLLDLGDGLLGDLLRRHARVGAGELLLRPLVDHGLEFRVLVHEGGQLAHRLFLLVVKGHQSFSRPDLWALFTLVGFSTRYLLSWLDCSEPEGVDSRNQTFGPFSPPTSV